MVECLSFNIMAGINNNTEICIDISEQLRLKYGCFNTEDNRFYSNCEISESNPIDYSIGTVWRPMIVKHYYETPKSIATISPQNTTQQNCNYVYEFLPDQQQAESDTSYEGNGVVEKIAIWRPFTPEPENRSLFSSTETNRALQDDKNKMLNKIYFPTIAPSHVKLGSAKSVFKAIKKKKYQCQHCSMNYFNNGQLTGHMRTHIGLRPYRCEFPQCSRAFARNEELTRHRRIHSGYKPHQCNICKKQFGRKDHLNKHSKTHLKTSEKKIHLCQIPGCGHKYTRSDALTRHHTMAHSSKSCKQYYSSSV